MHAGAFQPLNSCSLQSSTLVKHGPLAISISQTSVFQIYQLVGKPCITRIALSSFLTCPSSLW
jgi:hypothetical protein